MLSTVGEDGLRDDNVQEQTILIRPRIRSRRLTRGREVEVAFVEGGLARKVCCNELASDGTPSGAGLRADTSFRARLDFASVLCWWLWSAEAVLTDGWSSISSANELELVQTVFGVRGAA